MSSRDAYRSSAGRVAHCRLACIRVVIVFPFGCRGRVCPQRREPSWHTARRARVSALEASNRSLDERTSLRFGDIKEAQTQRLGSIAQRAFRGQVSDLLLLTERGARTV